VTAYINPALRWLQNGGCRFCPLGKLEEVLLNVYAKFLSPGNTYGRHKEGQLLPPLHPGWINYSNHLVQKALREN